MLGALGVVFGDIGTSPLYALKAVFSSHGGVVAPSETDVLGVISMVLWCLITIVTVAYIGFIMRADNQGEGGILALVALVPLALRSNVEINHVLHEHVVIITMAHVGVPHVPQSERLVINDLGDAADGVVHVTYHVGFHDSQDVPHALRAAVGHSPELNVDPTVARYFLSVFRIEPGHRLPLPRWQKALFRQLERGSANRTQVLNLPPTRTVVMGAKTEL